MPLPILQSYSDQTPETLVRLFHRTELHWIRHVGEEAALDAGVAFTNAEMPEVCDANGVIDAALPPSMSPDQAVDEVRQHFAAAGTTCRQWIMNPSAPPSQTQPLVEHLEAAGWRAQPYDIMHLVGRRSEVAPEIPGLTTIPARASFRHARQLAEEEAAEWSLPSLADASMLHLDDPHWDVLITLRDGQAVARAGVLAVGEVGRIDQVFVSASHRRQGLGRMLTERVLDVCARSLFKHVMLRVRPGDEPAIELYSGLGFRRIGQMVPYRLPAAS